jgi:cytochrome b
MVVVRPWRLLLLLLFILGCDAGGPDGWRWLGWVVVFGVVQRRCLGGAPSQSPLILADVSHLNFADMLAGSCSEAPAGSGNGTIC